jgi:hypothetical protein
MRKSQDAAVSLDNTIQKVDVLCRLERQMLPEETGASLRLQPAT